MRFMSLSMTMHYILFRAKYQVTIYYLTAKSSIHDYTIYRRFIFSISYRLTRIHTLRQYIVTIFYMFLNCVAKLQNITDKFSDKKKRSCAKFYDFILQPSLFTSFIYYVFNSKPSSTTEKSVQTYLIRRKRQHQENFFINLTTSDIVQKSNLPVLIIQDCRNINIACLIQYVDQ